MDEFSTSTGLHDHAPWYVRGIVKLEDLFGTHTSLTTERLGWLVAMPDGHSVRYSLFGRDRTILPSSAEPQLSVSGHIHRLADPCGRTPHGVWPGRPGGRVAFGLPPSAEWPGFGEPGTFDLSLRCGVSSWSGCC